MTVDGGAATQLVPSALMSERDAWPITDRDAFQAMVRKWITANWSVSITVREWWARLGAAGLTVPTWPTPLGGLGATTTIQSVVEQELARIGTVAPPLSGVGVHLVGPALRQFGTDQQRERFTHSIVRGTANWCLLFDEPDGADPTSVASSASREGSGPWSVDAVKLTAGAEVADLGLLLVRTDGDAGGREGLTCAVLDLDQPTVSVQSLSTGGSLVVCRGASVAADAVVGGVGEGFAVAQTVLAHRQTTLAGRIRRGLVEVVAGERAGNLDRTTGDVLTRTKAPPPPPAERRRRP